MIAALFASLSLFAYCLDFAAGFSMPKLMVLAIGLVPMVAACWRGYDVNLHRACTGAGLIFFFSVLLSAWFAEDQYLAIVGRYNGYAGGVLGVAIAFLYHLAAASSAGDEGAGVTRENVRGLRLIVAAGAALGVYSWAQGQGLTAIPWTLDGNRAIGTIGSPTDLGLALAVILPLALSLSPVYALGVALGLVASGARGAWIAAACGVAVYAWRSGVVTRRRLVLALPFALLLAAGAGMMWRRGAARFAKSDAERVQIWNIAVRAWAERPVLGHGPDSFGNAFKRLKTASFVSTLASDRHVQEDAHDDVLQVLATLGLVGLLAYMVLFVSAFRAVRQHAGSIGALVAFFVNAKVNPVPLESAVLIAVIVGLASGRSGRISSGEPLPGFACIQLASAVAMIVVFVAWLSIADYYGGKRELAHAARAAEINPYEPVYVAKFINGSVTALNATRDPVLRGVIVKTMRERAAASVKNRPMVATSWYVAGIEAAIERQLGLTGAQPLPFLRRAHQLDPLFGPIREAIVNAKAL